MLFFSTSHTKSDLMRDGPASKIREGNATSAYLLNAVNTSVFNEKRSFLSDFHHCFSDFVTCASFNFCDMFLFQRVPGCNSMADLSLKIVFWSH